MKIRVPRKVESYIPTASMADIAFLLIIFFMITTTIPVDRTPLDLPASIQRTEFPDESAIIAVTIDRTSIKGPQLLINVTEGREPSRPIDTSDLRHLFTFAANVMDTNPFHVFIIKADRQVPYEYVDMVIEQLRHAKVKKVVLLTEQETI